MSPPPPALDYPRWIAEALRLVVRRALERVEREGLPPEHHFLLSVATGAPGVQLPAFLRERYPDEITLVLENQFWDLLADDEGFSVTLAFGGARHRVFAPWPALTAFADPGARLALRFTPGAEGGEEAGPTAVDEAATPAGDQREEGEPAERGEAARVVRIDRFRRRDEGDGA